MRVVNKKLWIITITLLVVIECVFTYLSVKSYGNKDITEIKETNELNKEMFSMYVEQEDGSYQEYTDTNLFIIDGYKLDVEKSSCVDNKGKVVKDVLSSSNNKVTISSNKTSYCYLYFSIPKWCNEDETASECLLRNPSIGLESTMVGGLYRYRGGYHFDDATETKYNVDNYICFGGKDKNECNSAYHRYRIIGINEKGELKIATATIDSTIIPILWSDGDIVEWPDSLLFSNLNGDYFLNNENFVPQNWADKIVEAEWKYGDVSIDVMYSELWPDEIYQLEQNFDKVNAKVGLMYMSDYYYSTENFDRDIFSHGLFKINLYKSWVKQSFWWGSFMNRVSEHKELIWHAGYPTEAEVSNWYQSDDFGAFASPVIYLRNDIKIINGKGTLEDPFIIN